MFRDRVNLSPPPVPILRKNNPTRLLNIHPNIIPCMSGSSKWSLYHVSPHQNSVCIFSLPHTCHMTCPSHLPWFERPRNLRLAPHISILLAPHQKIQRPRKIFEKVLKLVGLHQKLELLNMIFSTLLYTYKIFIHNFLCSTPWVQLVGKECPLQTEWS